MNLEGGNEKLLVKPTGNEESEMRLSVDPSGKILALVSTRAGQRNKEGNLLENLDIVDLKTGKLTTLATSQRIELLDWSKNRLVFISQKPALDEKDKKFAGVASGNTKGKLMLLQQRHGVFNLLIYTLSSASIVRFFESFQRNSRNKIFDTQHFLTKLLIDQGAVGEREKFAIGVYLAQFDYVLLPDQRFTTGVDVHEGTQFFALADNRIHGLQS